VQLNDASNSTATFHLNATEPPMTLYADNNNKLSFSQTDAVYSVVVTTNSAPAGFDAGNANQVTVHVGWPAAAPAAAQTSRDYVQIISRF
jgi:hypothetical protein